MRGELITQNYYYFNKSYCSLCARAHTHTRNTHALHSLTHALTHSLTHLLTPHTSIHTHLEIALFYYSTSFANMQRLASSARMQVRSFSTGSCSTSSILPYQPTFFACNTCTTSAAFSGAPGRLMRRMPSRTPLYRMRVRRLASSSLNSKAALSSYAPWTKYTVWLERYPLRTKAATSGLLGLFGDAIAQARESRLRSNSIVNNDNSGADDSAPAAAAAGGNRSSTKNKFQFDLIRLARFACLNALLVGPTLHVWYGALARILPSPGALGALQRMSADQLVFAPAFIPVFFGSLMALEGAHSSPAKAATEIREKWWPVLVSNWMLWVPAQCINFGLISQPYQVRK